MNQVSKPAEMSTSSQISDEVSIQATQALIQVPSTQATQAGQRLRWTDLMEDALLGFLRQEVSLGKRADNSFKKKTWEGGVVAVRAVMSEVIYSCFILAQSNKSE